MNFQKQRKIMEDNKIEKYTLFSLIRENKSMFEIMRTGNFKIKLVKKLL